MARKKTRKRADEAKKIIQIAPQVKKKPAKPLTPEQQAAEDEKYFNALKAEMTPADRLLFDAARMQMLSEKGASSFSKNHKVFQEIVAKYDKDQQDNGSGADDEIEIIHDQYALDEAAHG